MNVQNQRGDTALHLAAYRGFKEIVQVLVEAWADPFAKNGQSKTPLQEAQSQQHSAVADILQKYMESLGTDEGGGRKKNSLIRSEDGEGEGSWWKLRW